MGGIWQSKWNTDNSLCTQSLLTHANSAETSVWQLFHILWVMSIAFKCVCSHRSTYYTKHPSLRCGHKQTLKVYSHFTALCEPDNQTEWPVCFHFIIDPEIVFTVEFIMITTTQPQPSLGSLCHHFVNVLFSLYTLKHQDIKEPVL